MGAVRLWRRAGDHRAIRKLDVLQDRLGGARGLGLAVARPAPGRIAHLEAQGVGDDAEDAFAGHGVQTTEDE